MDENLKQSLAAVASFYDQRQVGHVGPLGFRRSTDLTTLLACLDRLLDEKIIKPDESMFLDLGCADGRINVFLSYIVKLSVGIELDEWTLDEYSPLKDELEITIKDKGLLPPPDNTFLFHGDSIDIDVHSRISKETGLGFEDFDLFYTYLIMHEEFAELIREKAKAGAIFMVYGLSKIMPKYNGLKLLDRISPMEGILALYRKE
ncbi:MAG: hypothetical protein GY864_01150 [Desulfobacterales bacterium]|nr:hypothetical protein [Desulfobacterales bacterium]